MKHRILSAFVWLSLAVAGFAQSSALTINTTTGLVNIPGGSATPNFAALKVGTVTITPVTYGSGVATFLATPSSSNLAAAVTGETGTGALVFATSPTFVTPILGTPTSGTLTNCTLPISGITGASTVVANLLGLTNPSAVTWLRVNADNTITARTAAQTVGDIGAKTATDSGFVNLASDFTVTSSTTLTNTALAVTLGPGNWLVKIVATLVADSATPDAKFDIAYGGDAAAIRETSSAGVINGAYPVYQGSAGYFPLSANGPGVVDLNDRGGIELNVFLSVSTSGTVTLRLAQNTSSADALTLKAGATLEFLKQ